MKYFILISFLFLFTGKTLPQNNWQISISSGAISPEFLIDSPLGYQFEGRIFYEIFDSIQISISAGFQSWKEAIGFGGNKFKTIPLLAGIKQSFPLGLFAPYFSGELGVHFITREYIFQTYEPSERFEFLYSLVSSSPAKESVTKFALAISIGSTLSINKFLDLDMRIKYNNISYDFIYIYHPTSLTSSGKINFYSLLLGLNYKL